ncbi:hypothetical protein SAT0131_00992 [Staphylococcus aureus subsp. aureus T0131]|nr:hypothetical protein SAT0131_00992 [Staphylococcus aureus subsp. aureus T0131]
MQFDLFVCSAPAVGTDKNPIVKTAEAAINLVKLFEELVIVFILSSLYL